MNRGDTVWAQLDPPGASGAQAGPRPGIILADKPSLRTVLLIPFTTQLKALSRPGTVLVKPDQENGLSQDSVALLLHIQPCTRSLLTPLGKLSSPALAAVGAEPRTVLGL